MRTINFDQEWKRAFTGATRRTNKRLVLSYVRANQSFDIVQDAIVNYAKDRGITIHKASLMKHWKGYNPTYTICIQVPNECMKIILDDPEFWPENVNCRAFVPKKYWYVNDDDVTGRNSNQF